MAEHAGLVSDVSLCTWGCGKDKRHGGQSELRFHRGSVQLVVLCLVRQWN